MIVDLDLTLYSAGEFLAAHPWKAHVWMNAQFRINGPQADRAIDFAWIQWEKEILNRIELCATLSRKAFSVEVFFLTANPLTEVKMKTFKKMNLKVQSSHPHSKMQFLENSPSFSGTKAAFSISDRKKDAALAHHFIYLPIYSPIQRLKGNPYTMAFKECLCSPILKM